MEPATLGQRLRSVREKELGLSVRGLERWFRRRGYSVSHVSIGRYEADERVPDANVVMELVRGAKVSGHWLLTGEEPREISDPDEVNKRLLELQRGIRELQRIADGTIRTVPATALEQPDQTDAEGNALRALRQVEGALGVDRPNKPVPSDVKPIRRKRRAR